MQGQDLVGLLHNWDATLVNMRHARDDKYLMALFEPQGKNHPWIHGCWLLFDDLPREYPYHCYEGLRLVIDRENQEREK